MKNTEKTATDLFYAGEIDESKKLLKHAIRTRAKFEDYNNLGAFYCYQADYSVINELLAIRYLHKAHQKNSRSVPNLNAMAVAFYKMKKNHFASRFFKQAVQISDSYIEWYNLGVCFLRMFREEVAYDCFKKALEKCDSEDDKQRVTIGYAWAATKLHKQSAYRLIKTIENHTQDIFVMLFFLGKYSEAMVYAEKMYDEYFVPVKVFAMLLKCCEKTNGKAKEERFYNKSFKQIESIDYNACKRIADLKKVYTNKQYRQKMINCFELHLPLIMPDLFAYQESDDWRKNEEK